MQQSKFTATVTIASLRGSDIGQMLHLAFDPKVDFVTHSPAMSHLIEDAAPDGTSVKSYLRNYFMGARAPLPKTHDVSPESLEGLPVIEAFDLLARAGDLSEEWVMARIGELLDLPRVFAVSCRMGLTRVVDCFVEMHAREWFGPVAELIDVFAASELSAKPYLVSSEYSAKRIGDAFLLHEGTNNWNRAWLPTTRWKPDWDNHVNNWKSLISAAIKLADDFDADYQFLFVPEKDTLARAAEPGLFQSGLLPMLVMTDLIDHIPAGRALFLVRDLIENVAMPIRMQIPDSHLCAEDYWIMFYRLMERFGLASHLDVGISCEREPFHSDLGAKFGITETMNQTITIDLPDATLTHGQADIQVPLRNNHVAFSNKNAPVKKSLLILGDSHASIGANPMLTYIARHFFQSVEFVWSPFNFHALKSDYFLKNKYDYVLFETSQRFATPKTSLDTTQS